MLKVTQKSLKKDSLNHLITDPSFRIVGGGGEILKT